MPRFINVSFFFMEAELINRLQCIYKNKAEMLFDNIQLILL